MFLTCASTVRSYLKLYTTMDITKLAGFLEVDAETLRSWLLVNKQRSRQVRHTEGPLLDGEIVGSSDIDYAMQGDLIHVAEQKVGRKFTEYFLRNCTRMSTQPSSSRRPCSSGTSATVVR